MTNSGTWSPYPGSSSIILAVVLFIATGVLIFYEFKSSGVCDRRLALPPAGKKRVV